MTAQNGESSGTGKPGKRPRKERTDNGEARWLNPQPNRADISELENPDYDSVAALAVLFTELPSEDRVTVKYDLHSGRFLAMYFRSPMDRDMPVDVLSVRGRTAYDAAVLLSYFHLVKYEGEWGGGEAVPESRFG